MAFRELKMTDIREVLRRWQAGESARAIARAGVVDRKTAGRYIDAVQRCGHDQSTVLTDAVIAEVGREVQTRRSVEASTAWQELDGHRSQIEEWIDAKRPLRLARIHELLQRRGLEASYPTLWRYAHQELGWREQRHTVRVDDPPPGEEAQVDFGKMGPVTLSSEDRRRVLWVLLVTLSFSRYQFVWPTLHQTVEALCEGLDAAWRFFGGVVKRIVPDNMTAAIIRANPMSPEINRSFLEYSQSRGFFVDPARVRRPQDKPRVENQVPYVRERWFDGETLPPDIIEIREHAGTWCRDVAGERIHGTTRRKPRETFEAEERSHLLAAPTSPFDVPKWSRAKLHPDHHVQVDHALYSAPTRYIGRSFDVRIDRTTVRLYLGKDLIKMHPRVPQGKRQTDESDYPSEKADYAFRKIDNVKLRAHERGKHIGEYADRLLQGPLP
jgi:transposase